MCGIWSYIGNNDYYNWFMKLKHRGPDYSSYQIYNDNINIGFHRLSIMDKSFSSNQPYLIKDYNRSIIFICNGEIYNFKELINTYNLNITNNSDCLTIPLLYLKLEYIEFCNLFQNKIKGEFAFILYEFDNNQKLRHLITGRDVIGIRPLYYSVLNNELIYSSEVKGIPSNFTLVHEFEPGTIRKTLCVGSNFVYMINYFNKIYLTKSISSPENILLNNIYQSVIKSVNRRLDSDQPIGFLLSGGVDSSLVAAISNMLLNYVHNEVRIKTFCCGMSYGSDFEYASLVAKHINSIHTEVLFTPEEALNAINDVIYTIESWDTTTIRASVGQYLVSKYISQNTDIKVLFVGEGPDEVCSSYLFNWYAPENDKNSIHESALDYVKDIHYYDVKRADRCIARWGLEARVPLLDPQFIESYWNVGSELRHPKFKNIEKWWLRKAFDNNILPEKVLWRKKEAFSDGISSIEKSWFEIIKEYIFNNFKLSEEEYYKQKFIEYFGQDRLNIIPHYWQPKWNKDGSVVSNYVDPSARTLDIYN